MIINFSPVRCDLDVQISTNGDIITLNGDQLDFSDLPDGGGYPTEAIDNEFVVGGVKRLDGVIHITVMLPYSNPSAPRSVTHPEPLIVTTNGSIVLPEGRTVEDYNAAE